ncbi:MAG: hypothetical protein OJF49_004040 [Ktedonobacterales bacterium]|nr:MAG: hypothetical protein OJF49_004040 [Ktedonobacterales bacterium]
MRYPSVECVQSWVARRNGAILAYMRYFVTRMRLYGPDCTHIR